MNTRIELTVSGDNTRRLGLTVDKVREIIAPLECPADVTSDLNWEGQASIVVTFTYTDEDGDDAAEELSDALNAAGISHSQCSTSIDPNWVDTVVATERAQSRAKANAAAWLRR